jgi:filamentous hemagglutinin
LFGQAANQEAGNLISQEETANPNDPNWQENGSYSLLLHGLIGAAQGAISGGGNGGVALGGGLGAVAGTALTPILAEYLNTHGVSPTSAEGRTLLTLASSAVGSGLGAAVGGNGTAIAGSSGAADSTTYNYLNHADINKIEGDLDKASCSAKGGASACVAEAKADAAAANDTNNAALEACLTISCIQDNLLEMSGGTAALLNLGDADGSDLFAALSGMQSGSVPIAQSVLSQFADGGTVEAQANVIFANQQAIWNADPTLGGGVTDADGVLLAATGPAVEGAGFVFDAGIGLWEAAGAEVALAPSTGAAGATGSTAAGDTIGQGGVGAQINGTSVAIQSGGYAVARPGVSLTGGAATIGEVDGANALIENNPDITSVAIQGAGVAGPDYIVTEANGSQYYIEQKSMTGTTSNSLSNNVQNAIGNFSSNGAPAVATAQANAGQAKVLIDASGSTYWNDPTAVQQWMSGLANNPVYSKLNTLTVLTDEGPVVWTRP